MQSGIYVITNNKNLKCYVGSSVNVGKRLKDHKRCLNGNYHGNSYLQNAWNKYGEEAFVFEQVEECPVDQLLIREQFWLDDMRTAELGYNLSPTAGNSLGVKRSEEFKRKLSEINRGKTISEETKKKISEANRGRTISEETKRKIGKANRGKNNGNYGKPIPQEIREKMSESLRGRTFSPEHRQKLSESKRGLKNPNYGKIHSPEERKNKSDKMKEYWDINREKHPSYGKPIPQETREKISESLRGRTFSPEHRQKLSDSNRGRTHSPETKKKISEAKKKYYQNKKNQ